VFALMPWLRSYRILTKYGQIDNGNKKQQSSAEYSARLLLENARLIYEVQLLHKEIKECHPVTLY